MIEAKESFCPILHPSISKQADQGLDLQASHVNQNWLVNNKIRPYLHLAFFLGQLRMAVVLLFVEC